MSDHTITVHTPDIPNIIEALRRYAAEHPTWRAASPDDHHCPGCTCGDEKP